MDILSETQNLWQRFQRGGAFRNYLHQRLVLVVPALAIFVIFSVATTAGTVITLGGTRSILVLFGLLAAPVVLLGSLFVQVFVFLQWLENRAIALATHHTARTAKEELRNTPLTLWAVVKGFPLVVQAIGLAFLLVPLAFVWHLSASVALLLVVLLAATPAGYSLLDR
jgi:hypothetical protein